MAFRAPCRCPQLHMKVIECSRVSSQFLIFLKVPSFQASQIARIPAKLRILSARGLHRNGNGESKTGNQPSGILEVCRHNCVEGMGYPILGCCYGGPCDCWFVSRGSWGRWGKQGTAAQMFEGLPLRRNVQLGSVLAGADKLYDEMPLRSKVGKLLGDANAKDGAALTRSSVALDALLRGGYAYVRLIDRWDMLPKMNSARYDFACAEVDVLIYVVGCHGSSGVSLYSTEVYDPNTNKWTLIECIRSPGWGCFGCSFEGKLYVMSGRSNFNIGNSRFVDTYDPKNHTSCNTRNGCVMVTTHVILGKRLFCMEWKNQMRLAIFDMVEQLWVNVPVLMTRSSTIGFHFGVLNVKLLLFSLEEERGTIH